VADKVDLGLDKHSWHPSPLLGQIVLVTTLDPDGASNVAPKSWISMMAFEPPVLALGCNLAHATARNILARKEFVVNVPGGELIDKVWRCGALSHPRPVEAAGLTPLPAVVVQPPRIVECRAHLECVLDQHLAYGEEAILLGEIVAVSADRAACQAADPYAALRMPVYLEDATYGVVERSRRVQPQEPGD
jgi:flavin reductase (DIM6/NTAB) family NADH-FMN oxidoreductase RutF